jgi:hypothetical protein
MSNIEQEFKKCIDTNPENKQKLEDITIRSTNICSMLAQNFQEKFFPKEEEEESKVAENFAYKKEFAIAIFREASLWWNAQKSYYPLGNRYNDNGAIPVDNMLITLYISRQIKNLEQSIEENGIEIGQLNIHDHLDIPADEIISRDISKILKMGEEEDLPEIKVPGPAVNEDVSEAELESVVRGMKDLKPGQTINHKGKVITILAPVAK